MEEENSLGLSVLDFVPNLAFLIGAFFLVRTVRLARGNRCANMCLTGSLLVFSGGLFKATWKLLFTLSIANITLLSDSQFVLHAPGFLALLVSVILLARASMPKRSPVLLAIAPWKIPFLATMTLCSLGAQGILTYISFQRKARLAAWMFIAAVLCMLGMAGMASGSEQTIANQWTEEFMNTVGQISFAVGCFLLYQNYRRAGAQYSPREGSYVGV
jgi:hypothetical protein